MSNFTKGCIQEVFDYTLHFQSWKAEPERGGAVGPGHCGRAGGGRRFCGLTPLVLYEIMDKETKKNQTSTKELMEMSTVSLGKKIHDIRTAKGMSVRKAAGLAEITPSMLSQIENDQVNPSINTLRTLAGILETPLYQLFQEEENEAPVVHPENRLTMGSKSEPDIRYELLTPDTKGSIEFCMMIIPAGMSSYRDARSHEGEEVAYLLSGSVVLEVNGTELPLSAGDSVRIPPRAKHVWHNRGEVETRAIFAITPPSF